MTAINEEKKLSWAYPIIKPVFWKNEASGRMKEIMKKFFSEDQDLTPNELHILKWYVKQWIQAMPVKPWDYKTEIDDCNSKIELAFFTNRLNRIFAIDPF